MNDFYTSLLSIGLPVRVEYEFFEGDPSVGLDDGFEIYVYDEEGKEIADDLETDDYAEVAREVIEDFKKYCDDAKTEQAISDWEAKRDDYET
jgi:hypothetical protein